jgi:hypothetical protein
VKPIENFAAAPHYSGSTLPFTPEKCEMQLLKGYPHIIWVEICHILKEIVIAIDDSVLKDPLKFKKI